MHVILGSLLCLIGLQTPTQHPWPQAGSGESLESRLTPPAGFTRLLQAEDSFGNWLRDLPLLAKNSSVRLFNGQMKGNQSAHFAVVDIDVGSRDLQQCADAVMRLRAEYLLAAGREDRISFNFTSGHASTWPAWRKGMRPVIRGNRVSFSPKAAPNPSYENFRNYLSNVFIYAGSASLVRELARVRNPRTVLPGDVFIQGGYPGHAVMVMDVAENTNGNRVFLLAQSYMPAQQIHILVQPGNASPWYPAKSSGTLQTPEWRFDYTDLYRFKKTP